LQDRAEVCLALPSPAITPVGSGGWPAVSLSPAPNVCSRKPQSIARANFANACFISMIWSSRERNRSCSLLSRRSRGRIANPPLHQLERQETRLAIRGNPQNRFARKSPSKGQKPANFIYLRGLNPPAHSIVFKFFTDDFLDNRRSVK